MLQVLEMPKESLCTLVRRTRAPLFTKGYLGSKQFVPSRRQKAESDDSPDDTHDTTEPLVPLASPPTAWHRHIHAENTANEVQRDKNRSNECDLAQDFVSTIAL